MFTLHEIARISGLTANQLQLWRSRYDFPQALPIQERRKYTEAEVVRAINAAVLYQNGWRISKILNLSREELGRRAASLIEVSLQRQKFESVLNGLVRSVVDIAYQDFYQLYQSARKRMNLDQFLQEIVFPIIERMDLLWQQYHIRKVHRNLAAKWLTYLLESELNALNQRLSNPLQIAVWSDGGGDSLRLTLFCVLLSQKGIHTTFLGQFASYDLRVRDVLRDSIGAGIFWSEMVQKPTTKDNVLVLPRNENPLDSMLSQTEAFLADLS